MKSLKDEINDGLDNFRNPVAQMGRNIRDSIVDGIGDAMADRQEKGGKYSKPRKKGCLWTILKWYFVYLIIAAVLSECGYNEDVPTDPVSEAVTNTAAVERTELTQSEQNENSELPFLEQQISYANQHGIELHRFEKEERALSEWLIAFSEEPIVDNPIHLIFNDALFGAGQYQRTENVAEYLYYGELKDNRPHGYGMLLAYSENEYSWVSYGDYRYNLVYIGEFVDGRYEGFGLLFQESVYGYSFLMNLCPYSEGSDEFMDYYLTWVSYVRYFGEFEKGELNGKGNDFCLLDAEIIIGSYDAVLDTIDLDNPEYTVDVANYRAGTLDGYGRKYIGGYLYYAGEFDNDQYHGYGELYYPLSNILEYKGEYKYGKRHGTGTSYSQIGEVIYEGEWENDDYK